MTDSAGEAVVRVTTPDLNLMLALDALLRERSVTLAAKSLGLSQPSLSASLSRLRRHFDDELLQRDGNRYELTPLAERLTRQVPQALTWADRVFEKQSDFDPTTAAREFSLITSDAHVPIFGRALADLLRREAPGTTVRFHHSTESVVNSAVEHLPTVDGFVLPRGLLHDVPSIDLYSDRMVCMVSADDPTTELSVHQMRSRPWLLPYHRPASTLPLLQRLRSEDVEVRPEISSEDFLAVPYLVAGTARIAVVPERVARLEGWGSMVKVVDTPFDLGAVVDALWWHPTHYEDPGHRWFRLAAVRAAKTL